MATNTNRKSKVLYPQLSYTIVGILFSVHNDLGRYSREKQYSDLIEKKLKSLRLKYKREHEIGDSGNIVDFLIEDKIIIEVKAKRVITKDDYFQIQRYLQECRVKLGILVNFRRTYLQPKRILRTNN
ncbi:GxxExxY protein [Candidatus Woesebacteria bacterium]|nr:GxxExxY protein [Candidatus Woesebacteria bacterium]